jgi:hypothetical protein
LEDAINNALKFYLTGLEPTNNVYVDFYRRFKRKADERDRDLVEKFSRVLGIVLIFVSFLLLFLAYFGRDDSLRLVSPGEQDGLLEIVTKSYALFKVIIQA